MSEKTNLLSNGTSTFDAVVIGAGSAGLTSAVGLSKVGKKVLLIEREHMGGECTNTGCVPSKALIHHAHNFYTAKQIAGTTPQTDTYRADAFSYVTSVVDSILEEETPDVFEKIGITVVSGEARFTAPCVVRVNDIEYQYKNAVIATGSSPRMVDIPGLGPERVLTNQNLFQLQAIPERLLIIGGGPIGLEMAQTFAMLGSQVSLVERGDELARLEDPAIRKIVREQFTNLGITVYTDANVTSVKGNTATLTKANNTTTTVDFDEVLMAIGRVPNLPEGLEDAGIKADEQCILVDSQYRTSNKWVYAVGDVAQRHKFTHTADDTARQVVARIASKGWLRVKNRKAIPKVTYTKPEIAQVGMLEAEALAKYGPERIMRVDVPYTLHDRAKTEGATTGHLTVTVRRVNGAILGANLIGPAAGELINVFTLAIDRKVSLWQLRNLIFAYPTYSLVIKKAGDFFFAQQLASLKTDLTNTFKRHLPKLIAGLFWITLVVAISRYQTANDLTTTEIAFSFFDFIALSLWGPLLYILFYAIRPITFFPATALTILSGIFFGFLWGTVLTVIAATISAAVAYGVGRFFGANLQLEDTVLGNWVTALRKNTFSSVLTARLIFLPFDLISYAAGILQTRFVPFVAATFIGILLGTATFVSIGASLDIDEFRMDGFSFNVLEPTFLALSAAIFVISLLLSRFLKRWQAQQ
jgi:pyruvate/2-oxoglutarate dehydrogenase complex dihydrolipoamide dehydrogenase (E3) component/uncharacterized membrane protein YdjX (TVP38/TMEM64 family)